MMSKSLYTDNHRYTVQATELDDLGTGALKGIFNEFVERGYSPREIAHILHGSVTELEMTTVLNL
jgi:hypothetical protein